MLFTSLPIYIYTLTMHFIEVYCSIITGTVSKITFYSPLIVNKCAIAILIYGLYPTKACSRFLIVTLSHFQNQFGFCIPEKSERYRKSFNIVCKRVFMLGKFKYLCLTTMHCLGLLIQNACKSKLRSIKV